LNQCEQGIRAFNFPLLSLFSISGYLPLHLDFRNTLIVGNWDPNQQLAVVDVCKGTHLNTMGNRGAVDTLYAEEMMFLVDKSRMCLFLGDSTTPASYEECMMLMLDSEVSLEEYLVYAHLKSLGAIVFRTGTISHPLQQSITEIQIDHNLKIAFEVWLSVSGKSWSRKNPGPPSFCIFIATDESYSNSSLRHEHSHCLLQIAKLAATIKVPLKVATCSNSGIIDFFDCSLPSSSGSIVSV
jgi:hypothetical protein